MFIVKFKVLFLVKVKVVFIQRKVTAMSVVTVLNILGGN